VPLDPATNWFIQYLQSVGPFTAPVCVALVFGMWLVVRHYDGELKREREDLRLALADAVQLRERRAEDLAHGVLDYQEHATATRAALEKFHDVLKRMSDEISRLKIELARQKAGSA